MDKETLYDLRSLLALYPYYQPARLLLLQNLYLLHDPSFDEELRRSAVYNHRPQGGVQSRGGSTLQAAHHTAGEED